MQEIILKVTVQKAELQQLESQIASLKKSASEIKISTSGSSASTTSQLKQQSEAILQIQKETKSASDSASSFGKNWESAANKASSGAESVSKSTKNAANSTNLLGDSFTSVYKKMLVWQVMGTLVSNTLGAFRDAISTMQAVDDELVTVRKVTGATNEELERMEANAYKVASAYGVAASSYLESVSEFTRAGYNEQSEALAELAVKTQLVGDTDAETANQFLLSVDAAYKYNGAVSELSKVLDGANEIDNKYATSIQKMAEGLGKVAPIASQAHVGVDELTAAIGTITAVTQRSGTEASTALRALFLNIIGDTKTEIDEGVTWTTGEIAGLRDVIRQYASDAYEAAEATGSVINPMEAIAGLAQSMKDGLLTEQELMSMVSDIGGKLRTSQLLALIQNWDMYESMLQDFANAAGSADKEVENALDGWTAKTNILNNTWAELVSNTVDSDWIKGLIDDITRLLSSFDNLGEMVLNIGGILGGIAITKNADKLLSVFKSIKSFFTQNAASISNALQSIKSIFSDSSIRNVDKISGALKSIKSSFSTSGFAGLGTVGWIGIGVTAITAISTAIKVYKQNLEETAQASLEAAEESSSHASEILSLYSSYLSAEKGTEAFTDAQKNLQNALYTTNEYAADLGHTLEELSLTELSKARIEAQNAVSDVEKSLSANDMGDANQILIKLQNFSNLLADLYSGDILTLDDGSLTTTTQKLEDTLQNLLQSGLDFAQLADESDQFTYSIKEGAEGFADWYDTAEAVYNELLLFDKSNPSLNILEDSNVKALASYLQEAEESAIRAKSAVENLIKASAQEQIAEDFMKIDIEDLSDFEDYIESIDESTEYSEKFKDALYDILSDLFPEYAESAGIAEEATEDYAESQETAQESTEDLTSALQETADVLDDLSSRLDIAQAAFEDFDENGRLSYDTLSGIIDAFGDLDNLNAYIERLTAAGLTGDELNSILSEMTIQLLQQKIAAGELTQEDSALIEAMLTAAGVADAEKVVIALLTEAYGENSAAADSATASGQAFSNSTLDTSQHIAALDAEASAWNNLAVAKSRAASLQSAIQANYYDRGGLEAEYEALMAQKNQSSLSSSLGNIYDYSYSGGSSGGGGGGGSSGSSSAEDEVDIWEENLSALKDYLSAKEKVIEVDRREGLSSDELISRYKEMQDRIHALAEEYREANNVEDDDYTYALKDMWWEYADEIQGVYEDRVSLLESELSILEAQEASVDERADKMREIAAAMKKQIDYMESVGADQEDINDLTADWYSLLQDVTDMLEEAARERMQELIDAANDVISTLRAAQVGALDEQLSKLQSAHDAQKKILEIQEKQLAVEKAKIALENAKRERTVRYFNAATNQWEWMADAGLVEDAEEALEDAEMDLAKAYADQAYDAAVATIEKEKEAIEAAYDAFEDAWDEASESVLDGSMTLAEAFEYMAGIVEEIAENTGVDLSNALQELANSMDFDLSTMKEANATATLTNGKVVPIYINEKGQTETKDLGVGTIVHTGGGDYQITGGNSVTTGSGGYTSIPLFDDGGVLHGVGGIKASAGDEMILDPQLTDAILSPESDRIFKERASLLGYMFGASGQYAPQLLPSTSETISHNEQIYNFGNISLSEGQAKSMTVYDLAKLAGTLNVYKNS